MKKVLIYLFIVTIFFSCKKDVLTVTEITEPVIPIDSSHQCITKYIVLDVDSFILTWDTFAPIQNIKLIEMCTCDSVVFSYKNTSSYDFNAWEIFQESAWLTYYSIKSPPITINSLVSFSLEDTIGFINGPFYYQTTLYNIVFEDCE